VFVLLVLEQPEVGSEALLAARVVAPDRALRHGLQRD
jgi:hypothetical protein